MQKILIYTEKITPRVQYIFDFVLKEFSGLDFELTTNVQFFEASENPKISYSTKPFQDEIFLQSDEFLFGTDLDVNLKFDDLNDLGKCFYALSRYEEYLPFNADQHGRFSGRNRVYKEPFVDEWILGFQKKLKEKYPQLNFKKRKFELVLTCDVDQAWQYKHKGFNRTFGAYFKELLKGNWKEFNNRRAVISGRKEDPFDTFGIFKKFVQAPEFMQDGTPVRMIFFWLMGDYAQFDKNNPVENPAFQAKIREVSSWSEFGIHPSYASNSNPSKLKKEISRLSKILNQPVLKSRQHYLKLRFPETYRNLIANGIQEDYTLSYADETGFRAGTTTPFYWFDLESNQATSLIIVPFCAMDVAMRNYMELTTEESISELIRLKEICRKVKGQMVVLFHNSNFHGQWEGWENVLETLIKH